ncbi:MAG: helix-turn-helix transcriptional regulator [Lachnospiraceae bacterium]|nr:helix-turn-helix transcriptional regulator [Lachnospiraceae bacterium]
MDVVGKIIRLCQEKGISYYRLAKNAGLAYSSVSNMLHKNTIPSISTLEKICAGLDITLAQFFTEDISYPDLTPDQQQLLDLYQTLDHHQRELLLAYAKGLASD